jgi:hypothetical protein
MKLQTAVIALLSLIAMAFDVATARPCAKGPHRHGQRAERWWHIRSPTGRPEEIANAVLWLCSVSRGADACDLERDGGRLQQPRHLNR